VTVQYVAFDPNEMIPAAQVTITDAAIREYYNAHRDEFVRPAQVEVRYVTLNAAPPPEDTVAARQRAEELRAAAASGESFEEVAQRAADVLPGQTTYGQPFTAIRGQSAPV